MASISDDFNRADSTNLGAAWVEVSGDWSILSNQLSPGSAGGTIILRAATAMDTNDHYAQITITATTAASHGIWIRGNSNITQGYLVRNNGSSWDLFYVVGGSFTVIGTYTAAAVANDVVKLQAVGSAIKVYINGTLRISVTDTVVPTGTSVGVRSESTSLIRFDDFSAADITSGVSGDAALAGTATLTASGVRTTSGDAALNATATLTASGTRSTNGDAALTATANFTASGVRSTSGDSSLAATATLTADGTRTTTGTAGLAATATFTASGTVTKSGDAALAATATLTAAGQRTAVGDAALAATAALTADGVRTASAAAAFAGTAVLTAAGTTSLTGGAGLAATVTLTASGTVQSARGDNVITVAALPTPWAAAQAPRRWTVVEAPGPWTVKEAP